VLTINRRATRRYGPSPSDGTYRFAVHLQNVMVKDIALRPDDGAVSIIRSLDTLLRTVPCWMLYCTVSLANVITQRRSKKASMRPSGFPSAHHGGCGSQHSSLDLSAPLLRHDVDQVQYVDLFCAQMTQQRRHANDQLTYTIDTRRLTANCFVYD
jgi:hypothetical protein